MVCARAETERTTLPIRLFVSSHSIASRMSDIADSSGVVASGRLGLSPIPDISNRSEEMPAAASARASKTCIRFWSDAVNDARVQENDRGTR